MPHTADLRVEAWAPTREQCIAEAVAGAVSSFVDISDARPDTTQTRRFAGASDNELLAAVLDEVIYLLDTTGRLPVDVAVEAVDDGIEVRLAMADAATLPQVGAVPKAVSWHELRLAAGPPGWSCSVTLDV